MEPKQTAHTPFLIRAIRVSNCDSCAEDAAAGLLAAAEDALVVMDSLLRGRDVRKSYSERVKTEALRAAVVKAKGERCT